MFGHQDDKDDESKKQDTTTIPDESIHGALTDEPADQPEHHQYNPDPNNEVEHDTVTPDPVAANPAPADPTPADSTNSDDDWQHPGLPVDSDKDKEEVIDTGPEQIADIIGPVGGPAKPSFSFHSPKNSPENEATTDNTPHELIEIKQKALNKLTPLIDQLDQSPEDKFRTTMMMIQASDDQSLVKLAYDAANAIEDEKAKAQALLDIVNEINYFTQHPES